MRGLGSDLGSRVAAECVASLRGLDSVLRSCVLAELVSVRGLASDLVSVRGFASEGLLVARSRDSVLAGAAAVEDRKEAGLAVAVTAGRPWLTDAN